jgi:hypothetical protein
MKFAVEMTSHGMIYIPNFMTVGSGIRVILRALSQQIEIGSVDGSGTMLQAGRSRVPFPMRSLDFSIDLIRPASLWPRGRLGL